MNTVISRPYKTYTFKPYYSYTKYTKFSCLGGFRRTVLDTQEELWEPPLHGVIASECIITQGVRTARVRRFKGAYSGAEFNCVGSVRSRNNCIQMLSRAKGLWLVA